MQKSQTWTKFTDWLLKELKMLVMKVLSEINLNIGDTTLDWDGTLFIMICPGTLSFYEGNVTLFLLRNYLGFPQDRIDALIHQFELTTRHQSTQFGLHLTFGLHSALLHGADPNESLQTIKLVERLKSELNSDPDFLVKETRKMLLENTSKVFLKMIPDQEYENEQKRLEDKMLKEHLRNRFINFIT